MLAGGGGGAVSVYVSSTTCKLLQQTLRWFFLRQPGYVGHALHGGPGGRGCACLAERQVAKAQARGIAVVRPSTAAGVFKADTYVPLCATV